MLALGYNGKVIGEQPPVVAALCLFLAGAGSSACCISSMAVVARSFNEKFRGLAMSIPLGLLGLSAFVFSGARSVFTDIFQNEVESTYNFLLFLAVITGFGNCLASLGLQIANTVNTGIENSEVVYDSSAVLSREDSEEIGAPGDEEEDTPLVNDAGHIMSRHTVEVDVHKRTFTDNFRIVFKERDSQLLFLALFLLAGVGLSYVTSLGKVVQLLFEEELGGPPASDTPQAKAALQKHQSGHVALFSLASFTGRIIFGTLSDITLRNGLGRGAVLIVAGSAMALAVGSAATVVGGILSRLWLVTALTGVTYGAVFGVAPTMSGEELVGGVRHFGRNWGVMSWAPPFGNQLLSLLFGTVVDTTHGNCSGYHCFAWSFAVDAVACAVGTVLLVAFHSGRPARCARRELDPE